MFELRVPVKTGRTFLNISRRRSSSSGATDDDTGFGNTTSPTIAIAIVVKHTAGKAKAIPSSCRQAPLPKYAYEGGLDICNHAVNFVVGTPLFANYTKGGKENVKSKEKEENGAVRKCEHTQLTAEHSAYYTCIDCVL